MGRTIGFPTANVKIDESDKICPSKGVYAVRVKLDNQTLNGMMNIGTRPTIEKEQTTLSNEVHIFNFNKDIYNLTIQIEFIARIREEKKFNDINGLKQQLIDDQKKSMEILS